MAVLAPHIRTYHCICTSLLLATTHTLSTLPRRAAPSLDGAYILPVPEQAPSFSSSRSVSPDPQAQAQAQAQAQDQDQDAERQAADEQGEPMEVEDGSGAKKEEKVKDMPAAGYTVLLGMQKDPKITIIRREDGFEKRLLWRCGRCAVVVGYEITGSAQPDLEDGRGSGKAEEGFEGKVVYILPNGVMGTDVMAKGMKVAEGDVEIGGRGVGVWE